MPDTEIRTGNFMVQKRPPLVAPPLSTPADTLAAPAAPAACANCGTPLAGPYCAQCGQHVADFHRSVWLIGLGTVGAVAFFTTGQS